MHNGKALSADIDSLGAFWAGLQVLAGDVESAIRAHMLYVRLSQSTTLRTCGEDVQANIWQRYSALPETFNIPQAQGISMAWPLRPEVS